LESVNKVYCYGKEDGKDYHKYCERLTDLKKVKDMLEAERKFSSKQNS